MAPASVRRCTTPAIVEFFWPMATYTQTTPWPFWLMMASTATAVFPVPRSPMISSRCPRPMGISASIALIPVCIGSFTGWRSTMPGATTSTARRPTEGMGPRPSTGSPSGLTTRPR
jgi:hypothetical protein